MFTRNKSTMRNFRSVSTIIAFTLLSFILAQIYLINFNITHIIVQKHTYEECIILNTTYTGCKHTRTICKNIDSIPSSNVSALKPIGEMPFNGEFNEEVNPINDTFYSHDLGGGWMFKEETTNCNNVPQSGVAIIIGTGILNKAQLMNIGFIEARKRFDFDCVIFHDADLIPLDDRIPHGCDEEMMESVVHLSVGVSSWNYVLYYQSLIGGVLKIRVVDQNTSE
ncbi:uncharacterized protein DC041_0007270, partial [Schistosoma bovis]